MDWWKNSEPHLIYIGVVCLLGVLILMRTVYWLRRSTQRRKEAFAARQRFQAIRTQPPTGDAERVDKDRGISSIEDQFTVTRRLVIPIILGVTATAVALPFLSNTPGAFVSLTVAAVTVVVGIGAKPFVENAIAGLVISFSKSINIGDTLYLDDHYGTVEDITPTHTTIKIWDWRRYVLPNSQMLQSKFVNYSLHDEDVWAHVEFWVAYDAEIDKVREIALAASEGSRYRAGQEPPAFWIMEMSKEGIRCWVAAWAGSPSDAWMLTHDIRTELIRAFRTNGIASHGHRHAFADQPDGAEHRVGTSTGHAVPPSGLPISFSSRLEHPASNPNNVKTTASAP